MNTDTDRRIGCIRIDTLMIDHMPDLARLALRDCIPLRAEALHHWRSIEIIALHPDFEPVPIGAEAPIYDAIIDTGGAAPTRTWRKRP
jgi:hypothetical protein